ncbi:MAG: nitrilase family protein [Flavobacteriales bacterium]|nr:nitrilase family protein [Flavobacteriales bacterium]
MSDLKVMTVQSELAWENPEANRRNLEELIGTNSEDVDLIVLPEMFTTGFTMAPAKHAEAMSDDMPTLQWMRKLAASRQAVVTGTVSVSDRGGFFNRIFWVDPEGTLQTADKRHLFTLGKEHEHYSPGESRLIAEVKGWWVNPMCCYDLRFPAWCRNTLQNGRPDYDLQIFMANWPQKRTHHWDALLVARAIENQSWVIGVNITGEDGNGVAHVGHSAVYSPAGECTNRHADSTQGVLVTTLSRESLEQTRRTLSFLKDQDRFTIE